MKRWVKCGVLRDMISRIEGGESIPTLHVAARLAHGVEKTLTEFVEPMEGKVRKDARLKAKESGK